MFLQFGYTPLHNATTYSKDPGVVKILLDNGCDTNAKNDVS